MSNYSRALEELIAWGNLPNRDSDEYGHEHKAATMAEPFYWNAQMCDLLHGMAKTLPEWTLYSDDAIAPYGFMWFEKPIAEQHTNVAFDRPDEPATWVDSGYQYLGWGIEKDGICLYEGSSSPSAYSPRSSPSGFYQWNYGEKVPSIRFQHPELAHGSWVGITELWASAMELMKQQFIARPMMRADRATRRRLPTIPHEPLIHVVELRRRVSASKPSEESTPRDWANRWLVRGHWRNQPYAEGIVRPKWIAPYVKGPEGKPIKAVRARVFAVVR